MPTRTPPPTSLSDPPSPTELPVSNLDLEDSSEPEMLTQSAKRITKTITTTITPIYTRSKPIYIIVATSLNPPMGIGNDGKLPWPGIKSDMAFFKDVTSHVPEVERSKSDKTTTLNAVVMGRKTWESIPSKFRPLSGRLNVIITRGSSKQLGAKILDELKTGGTSSPDWVIHELPPVATSVPPRPRSRPAGKGAIVILVPRTTSPTSRQALSPILISSSISSTLALLSSPEPISPALSISTPTSKAAVSTASSSAPSVSVHKIFCIGGAEIYRQILSLSSDQPQSPTVGGRMGTDSGTGTDTEGETLVSPSSRSPTGDYFDVRILQTQIRKSASRNPAGQPSKKTEEVDFECDTFFPDLLPSPGSNVKSTKWRPVHQDVVAEWVSKDVLIPQHQGRRKESIQQETVGEVDGEEDLEDGTDGKELWLLDAKAGVELRVVGWQRR